MNENNRDEISLIEIGRTTAQVSLRTDTTDDKLAVIAISYRKVLMRRKVMSSDRHFTRFSGKQSRFDI